MTLICGINPVFEALAAGTRHFDRILVAKGVRNKRIADILARASRLAIPLRFELRETLDRMAGGVPHQGLMAVVSAKSTLDIEDVLKAARDPGLLVVLDGVEDPRNLGAIIRSAEAAGADGVIVPERHSAPLSETVAKASAGALEHVHVARVGNLAQSLGVLKEWGYWVVGFDASGTDRWDAVDMTHPVALVLGGEGRGIRRLVRESCDHVVSLPLFGHVGSLNVSVAAGIALYEVVRQRGTVPSRVRPIQARPAPQSQVIGPTASDAEPIDFEGGPTDPGEWNEDGRSPTVGVVDFHEDAAWSGPTLLKEVGFRRDGRRRFDQRKGRGERTSERTLSAASGEPGREAEAEAAAPEGASEQKVARRRRKSEGDRRRRPRPMPANGAAAPPSEAPSEAVAPQAGAQNSAPRESRTNARRGRGRRRRRPA